ncbi:chaperone protein DnaJ [bacterium BMS3Abin07]|nr:chaperone protein DnaJ [bacterium BMS3Abin07]GBE33160.1 chaperone protein DnaJ [bacterium BMS3Bbin05]HDL21180.1 DUF4388 domain-containing protein [Nitrospirota bacterium]HDO22644.1 DUF4388 domain-containing protein [Nitrospirota bacterium]HDZ87648.1 DUF4388 domain-containing protein [Nitrospirota bacterium]
MNGIPFRGTLAEARLSLLLISLNRDQLTGTLEIRTPGFTKKIYLVKGDAIFASSTNEDDRLGEMLLKVGKITIEQFDTAAEKLEESGNRLGAILVELGYLTPKELFWGVKYQVREIIYSLFQLHDAEYEFIEEAVPSDEVITLKMTMGNLIYEGVRRIDNLTRIRREMPSLTDILVLSNDPLSLFQDIELNSDDKKLLSLVDGRKTIKDILDESSASSFETMKILYVLLYTGILIKKEGEAEESVSITIDDLLGEISESEIAFETRVEAFLKKIKLFDYYDILEIEHNADENEVKKNYFRLAKEFHPDKYMNSEDPYMKDKLTTIFDALADAYNKLKVETVDTELQKDDNPSPQSPAADEQLQKDEQDAAAVFQSGVTALKKGDIRRAVENLKQAASLEVGNARYWNNLALAYTKLPDGLNSAENALQEAISLEPDNAGFLVNLGLIYMKAGNLPRAGIQFNKALILEPENKKAKKALQDLETKK